MSTLLLLADQAQHLTPPALAHEVIAGGLIERTTNLSADVKGALIAVGGVLAVAVALFNGWKARGAAAGVAVGLAVAALYYWGVTHVTDAGVSDQIDEDLTGLGPITILHEPAGAMRSEPGHHLGGSQPLSG